MTSIRETSDGGRWEAAGPARAVLAVLRACGPRVSTFLGLAALALCAGCGGNARSDLTAGDLEADFRYLVQALENTHPDPYTAYGGKVAFHRTARAYRDRITEGTTPSELRGLVNEFLAVLGDGHTGLSAPSEASGVPPGRSLPLGFGIAVDGMFVDRAAAEQRALVGARVLAVESLSVDSLLRVTKRLAPSENPYGTYRNLSRMLGSSTTAARLIPGAADGLTLTLLDPSRDTVVTRVAFRDSVVLRGRRSTAPVRPQNGLLDWQILPDAGVAYFVWNSIASRELAEADLHAGNAAAVEGELNWLYRYLPDTPRSGDPEEDIARVPALYPEFRAMLEAMKANGVQYLVIDLRRNGGGMTPLVRPLLYMLYGDDYLSHDFRAEFVTLLSPLWLAKYDIPDIERYNEDNGADYRLGDYRFREFWSTDPAATREERRALDNITYFSQVGAEQVRDLDGVPVHTPHVVVLTAPATFSAAFHFLWGLSELGRTTVVGVPSRQAGNAFMETTPFTLPNTGFAGSISNSLQLFFPDDPERGAVFMPDFPMRWADFQAYGFDPDAELLYALDLIRSGEIRAP